MLTCVQRIGHGAWPPSDVDGTVDQVGVSRTGLVVRLCCNGNLEFLDVRSVVDRAQGFLLPVGHRPALAGLASYTRLGRIRAVFWGLAYGFGAPPDHVRFEAATLRFCRSVDVVPRRLSPDYWIAGAEGVFASAALLSGARETTKVVLPDRW